jgi:hypothetical protein
MSALSSFATHADGYQDIDNGGTDKSCVALSFSRCYC